MHVEDGAREIALTIVYVGPAGSGKTTNLRVIERRLPPDAHGALICLGERAGHTLLADVLPVFFTDDEGRSARLRLVAAPGDPALGVTRRILLGGADGVVFVADGRLAEAAANNAAWVAMRGQMPRGGVPVVVQMNKADLPGAASLPPSLPDAALVLPAAAALGHGVVETLDAAVAAVLERHGLPVAPLTAALRAQFARSQGGVEAGLGP